MNVVMRFLAQGLVLVFVFGGATAIADDQALPADDARATAPAPATAEQLGQRLQIVKDEAELDDAAKAEAVAAYEEAVTQVKKVDVLTKKIADFERRRQASPQQIAAARAKLEQPEAAIESGLAADAPLSAWQQRLTALEGELNQTKDELAAAQAEPERRADRRTEISQAAPTFRQQLEALNAPPAGDPVADLLQAARDDLSAARRQALELELRAGDVELACYDATSELLPLERDLATRRVAALDRVVGQLRQQINDRRAEEAKRQEEAAREEAARAHPAVKALAEENHELTVRRQQLAQEIQKAQAELDEIGSRLEEVRNESKRTQARVKAAGLSDAVGSRLRRQRARLPDVRVNEQERRRRQAALAEVQLQTYELADERSPLANLDDRSDELVATLDGNLKGAPQWLLRETVHEALKTRRDVLDAILADYDSLHRLLVDLDTQQRELIVEADALSDYIDERVLWIHSLPVISAADLPGATASVRDLGSLANWTSVAGTLWTDASQRPDIWFFGLLVVLTLVVFHGRLRRRLRHQGEKAVVAYCESFQPTARAVVLTAILAFAPPAVMYWIAWRMKAPLSTDGFSAAVAAGLEWAAMNYLLCECVLKFCRPWGLAEAHFGWPRAELSIVRRNVRWLALVFVPATFVIMMLEARGAEVGMSTLGRFTFVGMLVAIAGFLYRILTPQGGVLRGLLSSASGRLIDRTRWIWLGVAFGVPGALGVLAVTGYYYTALRLTERLLVSVWLLMSVAFASGLMWRWLLLARRSLAIKQARARRAALQAEAKEGAAASDAPLEISQVDLSTINAQSKQLLRAAMTVATMFGVWGVWVDVLPALGIFNGIQLWARGTESPITLAHVLIALLLAAMTAVAYRNIPGLLEITILQRLPLDAGSRYAITSVSRYLIAVAGIVLAFEEIGVGWSKVQWLLAAMSVGLGFGLQEIFANFVSGLIILFERPVRVGDVVTVGEITGSVSRIRMRATTIVDGDRKELVVPNRTFITDRLVNWTLSDTITRLSIPIGVAYGSDVALTESILLDTARRHPLVMTEPGPSATFEKFGTNAIEFVLRAYVASTDQLGPVRHELNKSIERRLREQGIEISQPPPQIQIRAADFAVAANARNAA